MKKKNVIKLLLFISAFALLPIVKIIASSLGGSPNYFAYESFHHVFYDRESAIGFVRLNNGFTVTKKASGVGSSHGSMVFMDTVTSVSGAIDLRDTNTLFLNGDLLLENGVTLSTGGKIYSKGQSILLGGNLTIPANTVLHLGGQIIIDGQGNTLNLADNAQLFVDNNSSLTLRNLIISNSKNYAGNPAIKNASALSQLTLDNVLLDIVGDFYFDRGNLFINNDVVFAGTSAFVYRSCQPSFITSGAKLVFDNDTTFSVAPATFTACPYSQTPTTTYNDFILMQDKTSQICFDGANFVTTLTGIRLTNGRMNFDNKVSLDSNNSSTIAGISATQVGSTVTLGNAPRWLTWSPDGRFIAIAEQTSNNLKIYSFDGASTPVLRVTQGSQTGASCVDWSYDGNYIAVANLSASAVQIFKFTPPATLTAAGTISLASVGAVKWSPDGRFIAAARWNATSTLDVYSFSGVGNPILLKEVTIGNNTSSVSWSPDGKFVLASNANDNFIRVYRFSEPNSLTQVGSDATFANVFCAAWSPNGQFIAVGSNTSSANSVAVFTFDGVNTPRRVATVVMRSKSAQSVSWSPTGKFLVIGSGSLSCLQIYAFNGFDTLTLMGTIPTATNAISGLDWSRDGKFVVSAPYAATAYLQVFRVNYLVDRTTQLMPNSIVFGNSALGSTYDLDVNLLSGANVVVDGLVNFDNVN